MVIDYCITGGSVEVCRFDRILYVFVRFPSTQKARYDQGIQYGCDVSVEQELPCAIQFKTLNQHQSI